MIILLESRPSVSTSDNFQDKEEKKVNKQTFECVSAARNIVPNTPVQKNETKQNKNTLPPNLNNFIKRP